MGFKGLCSEVKSHLSYKEAGKRMMEQGQVPGREARWVGPSPRGWEKPFERRNGLVLSGGGLKFAVHTGIYDRMEKTPYYEGEGTPQMSNLPALSTAFDCLVGTSAGSLVASAIACGFCAEDIARFATLFSRPDFQPLVLDPNWLGAGSFLLRGDLGYIKGLYRGEAIQRTMEVFFSHNFLQELGRLYAAFAQKGQDVKGPEFALALGKLLRKLRELPREKLPQMADGPGIATGRENVPPLRFITFQDINPGARVPYVHMRQSGGSPQEAQAMAEERYAAFQAHAAQYRSALEEYYQGRAAANCYVPFEQDALHPMLLLIGTDIVTGQKTVFCNYNLFEKELVYTNANPQNRSTNIVYRYIDPQGRMAGLPPSLTEELRPVNYLYKYLSHGLPVAWGVRASLSIPGIFAPATIHFKDDFGVERTDFFVDGAVTDNYALQVAAAGEIGRCGRILGGNIGNLGPRVHNYKVRSIAEILMRTLLTMGDSNVDANASNNLVQTASVTTITELTKNDVGSIRELVKIPALLEEGGQLADQFFAFFRRGRNGELALDQLFGKVRTGNYIVFLPRIETYGEPPGTPAPPPPVVPDSCAELTSGASEIDRIVANDALTQEEKKARSAALGQCEAEVTPPPVLEPGGLLPGSFETKPGQTVKTPPTNDLINWVRRVILGILLTALSFIGLGMWRITLWLWERIGLFKTPAERFDSWNYWPLLAAVLIGALWYYLLFFRALIFDFWVAQSSWLLRRGLEIPVGLILYLVPLVLLEIFNGLSDLLRILLALVLIPFSAGALFFAFYAIFTFVQTLLKKRSAS